MTLFLSQILKNLSAETLGPADDAAIDHVSIDSRSLQNGSGTLFFALSGPHNDGHDFIVPLIDKGVRHFVVHNIPKNLENTAVFLKVPDTLAAFQHFAAWYRQLFDLPLIAITGSNGKTIVKEWLNFLLSPEYNIIRSPKSYNSQVGVPLSVMAINEMHNFGIFEAGISQTGEMEKLEEILKPSIGIFTNLGSAHDEGFSNWKEKLHEKMRLFKDAEIVISRYDERILPFIPVSATWLSWGDDPKATVRLKQRNAPNETLFDIRYRDLDFEARIPFADNASAENAAHCLVTLLYLGYRPEVISRRLTQLYAVEMRLQVKKGINNTTLIDDSYSSDFQSLKIALDFLESQKNHSRKTVILSDIFQSGLPTKELYEKLSQLIKDNDITRIIGVGSVISQYKHLFPNAEMFADTAAFIRHLNPEDFKNESILIKGARSFNFEKIVPLLEEKTHETVLEINLNALGHNLNFFRAKLKPSTKMMVMVKAFGYGNGGLEIAKLLEHHKIDYLGVAFADEGTSLKSAGISVPIMVMNPETTSFSTIIQHGLEPEIYSLKGLSAFIHLARQQSLTAFPIHLKLDTGMHRLGFAESHLQDLIELLSRSPEVAVKSILSHMATSDDAVHKEFALEQIALFNKMSWKIMEDLNIEPIKHILNSSGISNYPQAQFDMVRLGIGLYGFSNNAVEQKSLERVATLKSVISQLHLIPAGDSVGYGRRFRAKKETKIATIPIGYADGIRRAWGNGIGYVTINGKKARILGSVCMDMLMADATDLECAEGDTVIVFGESPSVNEMAEKLNTISYEILVGISQRVKRVFYRE